MSTPLSGGNRPGGYAGGDAESARQEHDLAEYEHDLAEYDHDLAGAGASVRRSSIGCVIPAHDDEATIAAVLTSLLQQTRVPDVIHVIVHGTSDGTVPAASVFAGPHEIVTGLGEQFTEVFVHDIGANPGQQIGALNYGYSLVEGYDFLLIVDGDAVGDAHAVEHLEAHAVSDTRIGGISAIRSIDRTRATGILPRLLLTAQRSRLAAATLQNLLPGRSTAMLGGQFSLLSITALRAVMDAGRLRTPWAPGSEAARPQLSLRINSAGFDTRVSPRARADVGGMTTLRAYDAQQIQWTLGSIELMWPGRRGEIQGQPLHPGLRSRWFESVGMFSALFVRVAFALLLAGALSIGAFAFSPWWLAPVAAAVLLNVRIALSMSDRTAGDVLFAALLIPAEIFTWIRMSQFVRAWSLFLSRERGDRAAAQNDPRGARWTPSIAVATALAVIVVIWNLVGPAVHSAVLQVGWCAVAIVAAGKTMVMIFKLLRRDLGYTV